MTQGKYLNGNGLKYLWQNIIKSYIDDAVAELNIYSPTTSSVWEVPYVDIDGLYDSKGVHLVCRKNQLVGISVYDEVMAPHRRPVYAPNGVLYTEATAPFEFTMGGKTFSVESGPQWTELNVEGITGLASMFKGINNLTSLSLCMDTSKVTSLYMTFSATNGSLQYLDLSSFDASAITQLGWCFSGQEQLKSLDLSGFFAPIISIHYAFNGMSNLEVLDISNLITTGIAQINGTFSLCSSLRTLKFPNMGMIRANLEGNSVVDLSACPLGTAGEESRQALLDLFSYDRVANGLTNILTVQLSTASKALLTPEEIAAITAKGYTIT